jgi:hypothetical protein
MPSSGILQGTPPCKHLARKSSKFTEIDYDTKSTFQQCSEISGDFEELHSDLLRKPLSRFALAKL